MANLDQIMGYVADNIIVEQGSDSTWTWRKWADGTAECWGQIEATPATPTAVGGWYTSYIQNNTFPTGLFIEIPRAFSNSVSWGTGIHFTTAYAITQSTFSIALMRNNSGNSGSRTDIYAFGRWR